MPRLSAVQSTLQHVTAALSKIGRVPLALLLVWILTVWWGEQSTYEGHVQKCLWNNWETWKAGLKPHHVLLVADPQIVDPHTYPDRPWPLSSLTVLYTDLYLKRSYRTLLQQLQPDSTLFLGDLFDGGREWGTKKYSSPDKQYKRYGQDFWLREYDRFQNMFVKPWYDSGLPYMPGESGHRLITSLPGNHDLGFGGGINPHVKSRFDAHFGPLNRIDILGNHTFVSLDTVSLSAMDQVDLQTGAVGTGDGTAAAQSGKIWKPVESYLDDAKVLRERAIKREVTQLGARSPFPEMRKAASGSSHKFAHRVSALDADTQSGKEESTDPLSVHTSQFPTIILTHVPLYRDSEKDCGPQRERGHAIRIANGYQYQNVLTPLISKDIVDKLDASQIAMVYSGDDHDYCEIEHNEFTGRIKEITVKSMSWAMGVRRPGVQLVSLLNPIELSEAMISSGYSKPTPDKEEKVLNMPRGTVQNHLCLLPDQLGIFIRYGELLGLTLIALLARALFWKPSTSSFTSRQDLESDEPLLPTTKTYMNGNGSAKHAASPPLRAQSANNDSISSTLSTTQITSRRNGSLGGYGNLPSESRSRSTSPSKMKFIDDSDDWGNPTTAHDRTAYARVYHDPSQMSQTQWVAYHISTTWLFRSSRTKVEEFTKSMVYVSVPVLSFYFWLLYRDM
ncbi:hypothetical protein PMZ80_006557 [Knufia obscura]|uniref:Calcineurin-like phosphoesterase domain-containing protein n=2 Tax=Knufia TaxID=430999 RepID=A0AAN8I5V9_9EURO|nr:hypothetical protein PMZ80_006557 [Knufia obscura]KAK5950916.1 hypothetical protein OHC33_007988 [Knufia fluminis]